MAGESPFRSKFVSASTQQLVIDQMQEMKLSWSQQKRLLTIMRDGGHFPDSAAGSKKVQTCCNRKVIQKAGQKANKKCGLRTKESIEQSGAYQREKFIGTTSGDHKPPEKERLQNLMAYGTENSPEDGTPHKTETVNDIGVDRFDEVVGEIEDRHRFLKEMKELGLEKEYNSIILSQISQKIRELEVLDKERCKEIECALVNPV